MVQFSVVVPTYNREEVLGRAVRSVLAQTFQDFEIIVVDDGSSDSTAELVKGLDDARIRYVALSDNRGVSAARNVGIDASRADLVAFLDSDDEFEPTFLEATYKALGGSSSSIGFSWTGTTTIVRSTERDVLRETWHRRLWQPYYEDSEAAFRDCLEWDPAWGTGHGVVIKRNALAEIGSFDESLLAREDIDLLLRLIRKFDFVVVPEFLVTINHDHRLSVDRNRHARVVAYRKMYKKYGHNIRESRLATKFFLTMIGRSYYAGGMYWRAVRSHLYCLLLGVGGATSAKLVLKCVAGSVLSIVGVGPRSRR